MKTKWEITKKGHTYYIDIQKESLIIGSFFRDGHGDNAGEVTFKELLDGKYHKYIRELFDKDILEEVIFTVKELI